MNESKDLMQKIVEIHIPKLKIISEANASASFVKPYVTWGIKKKRKEDQKKAIHLHFMINHRDIPKPFPLPCHVILTRIAPRYLDKYDNLPMAFKYCVDIIADLIKPGYAPGRADATDISFVFNQEKGAVREYGVKIVIYG